jgi:hypothetical protein
VSWSKRRALAAGIAVVTVLAVSACTGDDPAPDPAPTGGGTSSADEGWTREQLEDLVMTGDIGTGTVLGEAAGEVPSTPTAYPASIEVTQVLAGPSSTLVRFTLRGTDDSAPLLSLDSFNKATPLTDDIRDIALVDEANDQRLQPFLGVQDGVADTSFCTCAAAPGQMTTAGQLLSGTFPALDPSTTSVTLEVPGFPVVEDIPVTWQ